MMLVRLVVALLVLSFAPAAGAVTVRVGTIPIVDVAPMQAAIDQGYFRDVGIEIDLAAGAGGAVTLPALTAGRLQIVFSNIVSVLQGVEQGIEFRVITAGSATAAAPPDLAAMVVLKDGPVKTPRDLEGRKVAVNTLNNVIWLYARAYLEKKGVTLSRVTFLEVPFPQMPDAVLAGRVDAAFVVEPFLTRARESGKVDVLGYPYSESQKDVPVAQYVVMADWAREHPDVIQKFVRAYLRGVAYMVKHKTDPDGTRIISGYTKMDPAVVRKIGLPVWPTTVPAPNVEETARLMLKHGLLQKMPDIGKLLHPTAVTPPQ